MASWRKGQSGNPAGRLPGTGEVGRLRAALAEHVPDIIASLVAAAKQGDVGAAKLVLERVVPALRPEELPIFIDGFSGTRVELLAAVAEAIAQGKLDTARGGRLISLLSPSELDERAVQVERILESRNDDDQNEE